MDGLTDWLRWQTIGQTLTDGLTEWVRWHTDGQMIDVVMDGLVAG